jgi:hypothetical protein
VDAAAARLGRPAGPRRLEGRLTSPVPIETPLELVTEQSEALVSLSIQQDGQSLTSGGVMALAESPPSVAWQGDGSGTPLPMSDDCLACGARNPLGLRVGLAFDDEGVWAHLTPSSSWRTRGDRLHAAMGPVLLDEVAWWLGALVMKEGGLTNRLLVKIYEHDVPAGEPLVAAGRFADVTPIDRRRTFWRTESTLSTASGRLLAAGSIVFRGGAEYSERQIPYFRQRSTAEIFARMFPKHS